MGSLVRLLAIAASAVIALSLLLFAIDQSSEGRDTQVRAIEGQDAGPVSPAGGHRRAESRRRRGAGA